MTVITDLYYQLFGRAGTTKGSDIDMAEHGRVGGVSTGQPFKFVSSINSETGVSESDLVATLQELISRLAPLAGAMTSGAPSLRVTGIAMPSTAVTGPATSAQVIAALLTQTNTLWLNNTMAIQSNIQNVTA